jgi:soluble lytic murein transglycosylase-like protein
LLAWVVLNLAGLFFGLTQRVEACQYDAWVLRASERAGIPGEIAVAIMHAESSGRPNVSGDGDGARGLFQITVATWRRFSTRPWDDAFDPAENIRAGVAYLASAKTTDPRALVSWHNAGTTRYWKLQPRWRERHPNTIYRHIYRTGRAP